MEGALLEWEERAISLSISSALRKYLLKYASIFWLICPFWLIVYIYRGLFYA
jgi:hypothetical protein